MGLQDRVATFETVMRRALSEITSLRSDVSSLKCDVGVLQSHTAPIYNVSLAAYLSTKGRIKPRGTKDLMSAWESAWHVDSSGLSNMLRIDISMADVADV